MVKTIQFGPKGLVITTSHRALFNTRLPDMRCLATNLSFSDV